METVEVDAGSRLYTIPQEKMNLGTASAALIGLSSAPRNDAYTRRDPSALLDSAGGPVAACDDFGYQLPVFVNVALLPARRFRAGQYRYTTTILSYDKVAIGECKNIY